MPLWFKPNVPIARLLAVYRSPERFGREYWFKVCPLRMALFHAVVGHTAFVYPHLPGRARTYASRLYMKDMKKAENRMEETGNWSEKENI